MPGCFTPSSACRPAALIVSLILLSACGEQNTYVPPPPPKVTVTQPVVRPVTHYLLGTGNIAAVNSADLVARVPGFVQSINYQDGDLVKKGTVLFVIEQGSYQLKVQQAKASEANARANLTKAQQDYNRQAELVPSGSASKSALDNAVAARDSAQASLDQAVTSTKLAENDLSYTSVVAPFDGLVTARKVSIGSYVGSSPTVLASIVETDPIYVNFTLSEQDVLRIRAEIRKRGLTMEELKKVPVEIGLQTEEGYPHRGNLNYASPTVDASTGTLSARAILDNPNRVMLPGMFVRVRVPTVTQENALLVPDTALGTDQGGRYVLVVAGDNTVEQRKVEVGVLEGELRVIDKGLKPEDKVIVGGLLRAIPGQKVDPQTASAAAAVK